MYLQKYRILSIEAEKLSYANKLGGFSTFVDGKRALHLFSGMLDHSLESEKIKSVFDASRLSRKMYFHENGYDYTTVVINVSFTYSLHNFVKIGNKFVAEGFAPSEAFHNCAETAVIDGKETLIAISVHRPLEAPPLSDEVLGKYFAYDKEKNCYVQQTTSGGNKKDLAVAAGRRELREELYKNGFDCDGVHYVRYKRSAGSSREGNCLFIAEPLYKKMMQWTLCGLSLSENAQMDLASFEAYIALSLSSIIEKLRIPKQSILFMRDAKSVFETDAVSVELDDTSERRTLVAKSKVVQIENSIWDGEALLDTSVFEECGYADRGMMLLRNRFFKTCAFHTNLQAFFADKGITEIGQLCGYTQASSVSDIKMVVTESSLKYCKLANPKMSFEEKVAAWLEQVDDIFGIVKTDKPTGFFDGKLVLTSYQLLNTLGLTPEETAELLKNTFSYYERVRASATYMRHYLHQGLSEERDSDTEERAESRPLSLINIRHRVMQKLLSCNDDIIKTTPYKEFRRSTLLAFSEKIRNGRLLVFGTNATIFGNGYELLAASIGQFKEQDSPITLKGDEISCRNFPDGQELLGCRSPHVTMGNLLYAQNRFHPLLEKYFRLTREIVCINAIGNNIQQRLNGCDYDSDAMLLTNDPIMVEAAKRNVVRFAVPVCSIASKPKRYDNSPESRACLDHEISQNKIGEIINRSQLLNTLYWHNERNAPESAEENQALYRDICILSVLSGMEIDKAKRNYDVGTQSILRILNFAYRKNLEKTPSFFNFIMEKKCKSDEKADYDTTMDYIFSQTLAFTKKGAHDTAPKKSLCSFLTDAKDAFDESLFQGTSNEARDLKAFREDLLEARKRIETLRAEAKRSGDEYKALCHEQIDALYEDVIEKAAVKIKNLHALQTLLKEVDHGIVHAKKTDEFDKKFYWLLFEVICLEKNAWFYQALTNARKSDMYQLVPDENGSVLIYDIPHSEKAVKFAKI